MPFTPCQPHSSSFFPSFPTPSNSSSFLTQNLEYGNGEKKCATFILFPTPPLPNYAPSYNMELYGGDSLKAAKKNQIAALNSIQDSRATPPGPVGAWRGQVSCRRPFLPLPPCSTWGLQEAWRAEESKGQSVSLSLNSSSTPPVPLGQVGETEKWVMAMETAGLALLPANACKLGDLV